MKVHMKYDGVLIDIVGPTCRGEGQSVGRQIGHCERAVSKQCSICPRSTFIYDFVNFR